jgi:spore coat protein M/HSP20 family protein
MLIRVPVASLLDEMIDASAAPVRTMPAVDIIENDDETVVVAELPGVAREDITVNFERNILTFSGERKSVEIPENARVLLHEQRARSFRRSMRISHDVDRPAISASLQNGILRIVLPKAEVAKPRIIEVR